MRKVLTSISYALGEELALTSEIITEKNFTSVLTNSLPPLYGVILSAAYAIGKTNGRLCHILADFGPHEVGECILAVTIHWEHKIIQTYPYWKILVSTCAL